MTFGKEHALGEKLIFVKKLDSVVVAVVLVLINLLFAAFLFFQIKYLFGNAEFVLKSGFTFAEYARKGFFELVWVVLLASALIMVVYRSLIHHNQHLILKSVLFVFLAQVMVVAISALKRMNLYQAEYGYTVPRLYVEWFIYFVLFLLLITIFGLIFKWQFRNLFYSFLIAGLGALTIVCSINVDQIIADKNISLAITQKKELDVRYLLFSLSKDAAPSFFRLVKELPKIETSGNRQEFVSFVEKEVKNERSSVPDSFLEFNWGRFQAREILKNL